jgi:4'-phosphopantetheinyl transferase
MSAERGGRSWPILPVRPKLEPGQVHVWQLHLGQGNWSHEALAAVLSEDELTRSSCFRWREDSQRYITWHGLLRQLLSRYVDCDPRVLQFERGPYGKPELTVSDAAALPLRFNISHSEELCLFAICLQSDVGIDIECLIAPQDIEALSSLIMSSAESAWIKSVQPSRRRRAFLELWTCKEACLKAGGWGVSVPPTRVNISLAPPSPVVRGVVGRSQWSIHFLDVAESYIAAVAVAPGTSPILCWTLV